MFAATAPRRPPGLRFTTLAAPLDEVLPRMDVAVFVGFAERGPLNVPVAVEDTTQFEAVFGADIVLAWDEERSESVSAYLAPAVRAFFRNGGVRCWVMRVAGAGAVRNVYPIAGLVNLVGESARPAVLRARSRGSWSDGLSAAGGLQTRPMAFLSVDLANLTFRVEAALARGLVVGDLLRLAFPSAACTLYVGVARVDAQRDGTFMVFGTRGVWLSERLPTDVPQSGAQARVVGIDIAHDVALGAVSNPLATWPTSTPGVYGLDVPGAAAPEFGALVRVDIGPRRLLLVVDEVSPPRVTGHAAWWLREAPAPLPTWGGADLAEVLTLELTVREGAADPLRLGDLGVQPEHGHSFWSLPTDEDARGGASFPLAGPGAGSATVGTTTIPLALSLVPRVFSRPLAVPGLPLERDGLGQFSAALFTDPVLAQAVADLDEATLIAVPDAVHRPWQRRSVSAALPPHGNPPTAGPDFGTFLPAGTRVLPPPVLGHDQPDSSGTFELTWQADATLPASTTFTLQEARVADFSDAFDLASGVERQRTVYGRAPGTYYYRVRAHAGINSSDWSNGVVVQIAPPSDWLTSASATYDRTDLLAIQRALIGACAARGDLLAVLTMPSHYQSDDARQHVTALRAALSNDARALSFGALYHPWSLGREDADPRTPVRRAPLDGALCGMIAHRAIARGAWVAPANTPLRGVVALEPPIDADVLFDSGVNGVRREARGFMPIDADTLSNDPDLRLINVRRLLSVIRRLALRHGPAYVFEPHGDALRRRVQHGFEAILDILLARGAFAGADSRQAYQVRVDATQSATDLGASGQLTVDLAVAPALPMRFLTVRLVQSGGQSFTVEVP